MVFWFVHEKRKLKLIVLQKVKGLSTSQTSEPDFDNVAEERIKKLKMRNSELVAIARKLEEKARQLQEEKDLLEVNQPGLHLLTYQVTMDIPSQLY